NAALVEEAAAAAAAMREQADRLTQLVGTFTIADAAPHAAGGRRRVALPDAVDSGLKHQQ
ncbi:MAG TPA: hypothetical protein VEB23_00495, partial [Ramlibacter sp.]|nr:hypothetical protein [Ramlibacter sp.]